MTDSQHHPRAHEDHSIHAYKSDRPLIIVLAVLIAAYFVAVALGFMDPHGHGPHKSVHEPAETISVIPFVMLLGAIAVFPLMDFTMHWWEHNTNKLIVAAVLGLVTLLYLTFLHPAGSLSLAGEAIQHAIIHEYVPFIILLFSLYTICGGIRIAGDLEATPWTNTRFILAGGLLASFIGTTGAAMLLIRPLLETNSERRRVAHTVVFFIFIVCNCGGLLLPLGDPPLFLGYLQGVPFLWTLTLWRSWLLVNSLLLLIYFLWDHFYAYPRETKQDIAMDVVRVHRLRFSGLWPNALLLIGVVFAVGMLGSSKPIPGTNWTPWLHLREVVLLGLVLTSLLVGARSIRVANSFNYIAIVEVAVLFVGIFICMQPALEILNANGSKLGVNTPRKFFWATGALSAVLDNAPTYLVFFETAKSIDYNGPKVKLDNGADERKPFAKAGRAAGISEALVAAISLGAVFMGAMTYIGNGPNFMVKSIAESSGVKMPSFFGFVMYSCAVLLPILVLHDWLFF